MAVGIYVHDRIVAELFEIAAVCIHRVKAVLIIRVRKKDNTVILTEQTGIVEVAGGIAVDIVGVIENPAAEIIVDKQPDNAHEKKYD